MYRGEARVNDFQEAGAAQTWTARTHVIVHATTPTGQRLDKSTYSLVIHLLVRYDISLRALLRSSILSRYSLFDCVSWLSTTSLQSAAI